MVNRDVLDITFDMQAMYGALTVACSNPSCTAEHALVATPADLAAEEAYVCSQRQVPMRHSRLLDWSYILSPNEQTYVREYSRRFFDRAGVCGEVREGGVRT
eukprot:9863311-Alexandrium_andersonii.AAC.1